MSNHSKFFLHFGTEHPYDVGGIEIQTTAYQHRKKGGWFIYREDGETVYWSSMDLVSGFILGTMLGTVKNCIKHASCEYSQELYNSFKKLFSCEPETHWFDLSNPEIEPAKIEAFVDECGQYLEGKDIKIVAVDLTLYPEGIHKKEFIEFIKKYNLQTAKYCQVMSDGKSLE
jgi:hypothetical protein